MWPVGDFELLLCHGTVCVVGKIRDLILQLSKKSSIYSTKPHKSNPRLKIWFKIFRNVQELFCQSSCEIKPYDNGRTLPCFGSTSIMAGKYFTPRRCACPLVSPGIRQQRINHAIHGNGNNTQTIRIPEAINDLRQLPVDGVLPR